MNRYHKAVYTNPKHLQNLRALTDALNRLEWTYSGHCLDNIKYRVIDQRQLLLFIRGLILKEVDIFEYYLTDTETIEKICYRINYNPIQDIILVLSKDKTIITIYVNSKNDLHYTLKKEQYINA